jgi:hypothetical protein
MRSGQQRMKTTMLRISPGKRTGEMAFAEEYRDLQCVISRISGEPPPPCYYCTAEQLWNCSETGTECSVFRHYCSEKEQETSK